MNEIDTEIKKYEIVEETGVIYHVVESSSREGIGIIMSRIIARGMYEAQGGICVTNWQNLSAQYSQAIIRKGTWEGKY